MASMFPIDFLGRRTWPPLGLLLLLLALGWLGWEAWRVTEESRMLADEKAGMTKLVRSASTPTKPMSAEERQRHTQIEAVARYLASPWATWLAALEDNADGKAIVRRLEQDATNESLKVTARSTDVGSMMAYVLALQGDSRLKDVKLVSHELLRSEPGTPVQFELVAGARPLPAADAASAPSGSQP
jgi:Tfp pilus assembly protein PilN